MAAGVVLLWPVLAARHGRGIALATVIALATGTVAWGIARGAWGDALGFVVGAVLVRVYVRRPVTGERASGVHARWAWIAAVIFGALVLVVRGAGPQDVLDGLFSSWKGLLFWSPILWLAIAGLLRERAAPRVALLLPLLLVAAVVGAVTADHGPYRGARFAPVLPVLAIGLARGLAVIRDVAARRPLAPVAIGLAALVAWNLLLMAQYRDGRIPRDDTLAFPRVARNAVATVSAGAGSPTAWPANWVYGVRHGVRPARYDLLGGTDLFGEMPPGGPARGGAGIPEATIEIGHLPTDEAVLRGGWSVRHACGDGVCRAVEGTAVLDLPIARPRDVDVTVFAVGDGAIRLAVNGVAVLAGSPGGALSARVPAARFRRGMNTIVLDATPGARALVDRIVFRPVTP